MSLAPSGASLTSSTAWLRSAREWLLGTSPSWAQRQYLLSRLRNPDGSPVLVSPEQEAVLRTESRLLLATGGMQSGKSFVISLDIASRSLWLDGPVWIVAPDYTQGRHIMRYLEDWFTQLDMLAGTQMADGGDSWQIRLETGVRIQTFSGTNPSALAGESPSYIALDEASQVSREVYRLCRLRVVPRGGWLRVVSTLGVYSHWFTGLYQRWLAPNQEGGEAYCIPSWSNRAWYPEGRHDPKIRALETDPEIPPEEFLRMYAGVPQKPQGLVFPDFDGERHVREFTWGAEPLVRDAQTIYLGPSPEFELWIDPGYQGSYYAILVVARRGQQVCVVAEETHRLLTTQEMIPICQMRTWWPYVTKVRMDIAGKQHQANQSVAEVWTELTGFSPVMERIVPDVAAARIHTLLLTNPLTREPSILVSPTAKRLLWEFQEGYRHRVAQDGTIIEEFRDKDNDSLKALGYGAVQVFGATGRVKGMQNAKRPRARLPWQTPLRRVV